jgi:acyl carrier protein
MTLTSETALQDCIRGILSDYSELNPSAPLNLSLSIRNDLAIDSLTFVSILLRLEDALEVDLIEKGVELHTIESVGDLIDIARSLSTTHHKESA